MEANPSIKLTYTNPTTGQPAEVVLVNDNNKPTPTLIALALAELTIDIAIGYGAYRLFKAFRG